MLEKSNELRRVMKVAHTPRKRDVLLMEIVPICLPFYLTLVSNTMGEYLLLVSCKAVKA
ncbi:hypothetical protein [Bacteroides ihuae]|uniref:hypothetical protein n=1 Tax=Bacteroides ihuae TaxID=1852362 RepID=UPI00135646CE|nr:hypothetical protein [Bacteroides ihuae]